LGEKEEVWEQAFKVGLVKGSVGSNEYLRTSLKSLKQTLIDWENDKLKPHTDTIDMSEFIPPSIDAHQQQELSKALSEIERQKRIRSALEAENTMLRSKLSKIEERVSKVDLVVERSVLEEVLQPAQSGNNGEPTVLCEVMVKKYSCDGNVYVTGQTVRVPQSRTYTNSLKLLEPRKKILKQ